MRDPYHILGVARSAGADDIRAAFRKLAKKLHPDLNPGQPEIERRFKEVNAAYSLLSDPDKRARFDRGEIDADGTEIHVSPFGGRGGAGARTGAWNFDFMGGGSRAGGGPAPDIDIDDLLGGLFGRRAGKGGTESRGGGDHRMSLTVDFLEAVRGSEKRLMMPDGGAVDLTIPAGIEDGQVLRLRGQGGANRSGNPSDVLVEVKVLPHRFFRRVGDDIHVDVPVTLAEAVLGARIKVPTIGKSVMVTVPARSDTGTVLRLRGKGIHRARAHGAGDQIITLKVMVGPVDAALEEFLRQRVLNPETDPRRDMVD
jgi:DnaJ-class molecular chaperone